MTLKRIKSWDWKSSPPACIILLVTPDGPGDPSGLSFLISDSSSLAEIGSVKMGGGVGGGRGGCFDFGVV